MDIDDIIESFEIAWATDHPPEILEFLPQGMPPSLRRDALLELIKVDIHHRFRANSVAGGKRVEEYLNDFAEFDLKDQLLPLIEEELAARTSEYTLQQLTARFPSVNESVFSDLVSRTNPQANAKVASLLTSPGLESRFEIRRVLGQGGMGRVFLAFDVQLQRDVAVKVPIMDLRQDPIARQRFLREGRLAASFKHPNAVTVHEINEFDGQCFIVSEFINGPTLNEWLSKREIAMSPVNAAEFIKSLAITIQAAHSQGILHRDLKPPNVLLEISCEPPAVAASWIAIDDHWIRPRITDFGLASCVDEMSTLTTSGAVLGTAAYMSPEQATGLPLGPTADIFSIGLMLYETLYGVRPWVGRSFVEVVDRFRGSDPIHLPSSPEIPSGLRAICERCLQFDVADRYQSATEVVEDLSRFLIGEPTLARPASRWTKVLRKLSPRRRIGQAAYFTIFVQTAFILSFSFILLMKGIGAPTGIGGDFTTMLREVSIMAVFPTLPMLALGVLTTREHLWAFWGNLALCFAMLGLALYTLRTGETILSFYRGHQLATFAAHSIVLGSAVLQVLLHMLALPAVRRIHRQRRWIKNAAI